MWSQNKWLYQETHVYPEANEKLFQVQLPMLEALRRFPSLVCASIKIGEAYMINLGRASRMVLPGRPSLRFSSAYANDLYFLTPGNIYVNRRSYFIKLTQNKQTCRTCVRHFSPHAEMNAHYFIHLSKLNYSLGIESVLLKCLKKKF